MKRTPKRNGIGEGTNTYIVRTYAIVEVTSQPVHAENPLHAAGRAARAIDFELLLRNIVGNGNVQKVEYVELDGSDVINYEELDGHGYSLDVALCLDKKGLDDLLK